MLITGVAAGHGRSDGDGVGVGQLPGPHGRGGVLDGQVARVADQGDDLVAAGQELVDDVPADVTGAADEG